MFRKRLGFVLITMAIIAMAGGAWAQQLPAPNWGPGFPRLMGERVLLMWLPVAGAENYKIYRNGEVIAESAATNMIDQEPQGGDNRYVVVGVAGGAEGARSPEKIITLTITKAIVVQPPAGLVARVTEEAIAVVWNRPKGTVLAFNVYRSDQQGVAGASVGSVQDNKYLDQSVEEGKTYYYTISALDSNFIETARSKELSVAFVQAVEEVASGARLKTFDMLIKPTEMKEDLDLLGSQKLLGAVDVAISYKNEKVYIVDQTAGNIKVFDLEGKYLFQFGKKGRNENDFALPYGICVGPDDNVYVADCVRVFTFSPDGALISHFKPLPSKKKEILEAVANSKEGKKKGLLKPCPVDVAFDSKGNMLVVDNANARVMVYDDGKLIKEFGHYGYEEGQLKHPSYLAVNSKGDIAVVDGMNRRAQMFNSDYEFKVVIGEAKTFVGSFLGLGGIAVTAEDNFVIADPPMSTVQVFDKETGEYLYHFGNEKAEVEPESKQRALWDVINPAGVAFDIKNNNLWITMPRIGSAVVRHLMD